MAPSWPSATISPSLWGKIAASSSGGLAKKNLSENSRYSGHLRSTWKSMRLDLISTIQI